MIRRAASQRMMTTCSGCKLSRRRLEPSAKLPNSSPRIAPSGKSRFKSALLALSRVPNSRPSGFIKGINQSTQLCRRLAISWLSLFSQRYLSSRMLISVPGGSSPCRPPAISSSGTVLPASARLIRKARISRFWTLLPTNDIRHSCGYWAAILSNSSRTCSVLGYSARARVDGGVTGALATMEKLSCARLSAKALVHSSKAILFSKPVKLAPVAARRSSSWRSGQ